MKRRGIVLTAFLLVLQLCCGSLWARPTTEYEAEMVVTGWLKANTRPLGTALGQEVTGVETFTDAYGQPVYYIVYLQGPASAGIQRSGFVIVSADDLVEPIIGFADDGTFDPSLDHPLGALVTNDLSGRVAAARSTFSPLVMHASPQVTETQSKWRRFISLAEAQAGGFGLMILTAISESDVRVAPLVQSKWGQRWYYDCNNRRQACYNYYTPPFEPGDPNNYPTGCVATAMAQLMRYHQHPTTGIGVNEFTIRVDDVEQTAYTRGGDGTGGPYRWSDIVLMSDCSATETQRQAIGALCYDAGVAVNMAYSTDVSSAGIKAATDALKTIFKYSHAVRGYNWNSVSKELDNIGTELNDMVNPNLDASSPVILAISQNEEGYGHAVLCDGYGYDSSTLYHHLNMGWYGKDDAWYNLPTIDSDPYFDVVTECIYNIFTSDSGEIISGRVINTAGNPIRNAVVAVQGSAGSYTTVTNSKGIYALKGLDSDSAYTVTVTKSGYNFIPQDVTTEKSTDDSNISGNKWGIDFVGMEPWRQNSIEDFETGDFGKFAWEHAGDARWTITSQEKHFGAYSAQAGLIEDGQRTTLQVTLDCASRNITFYHKVSSESGSDNLRFYIDGVQKDRWSGTKDWAKVSFGITAGTRTFKWVYSKDGADSEGDDTAWIDNIEFPIPITLKTAYNPEPSDGAVDVNPSVSLSWTAGSGAVTHDVYFDTDEAAVANATISLGQFKGNQSGTTYAPGPLALGTTYYWRVDEVQADGITIHKGNVWSFSIPRIPDLPVTDPSLMGWWKFDANSGTTAVDWSGHEHHGTLRGNPQWVAGYYGGALGLDGSGDYVNIDGWTGILGSHAITVSAWVKTINTVSGRASNAIVGWGRGVPGQKFAFGINDARLRTEHHGGNRQGNTNVADGQWHHVAVTVKANSTISYPEVMLFLDGQDDTIPGTDPDAYNITAGRDVSIGRRPASNDRYFDGIIDDVRIYDKALTQDQIEQVMRGAPLVARVQ